MRIIKLISVFAIAGLFLVGCEDEMRTSDFEQSNQEMELKGNGFPSGAHYNLNLIGVPKAKKNDVMNNSGHRIFVNLDGNSKIYLQPGDFKVIDANATDRDGGLFQLPVPELDPETGDVLNYAVYARPLGKPYGNATLTTCATFEDAVVCSEESYFAMRTKGKSPTTNVSKILLSIVVDIGDGLKRYPLFHDDLEDYFWNYDNNGLKLLQLRFYMPVP